MREDYVETVKSLALLIGKKLVLSYLGRMSWFFALPITQAFLGFVVGKILFIAIKETEMGAFFLYTDFRTSSQGRAFFEKAKRHQVQLSAGSLEDREKAEAELIDAFRSFVKFSA